MIGNKTSQDPAAAISANSGHVYIDKQTGTIGADCRAKEFVLVT